MRKFILLFALAAFVIGASPSTALSRGEKEELSQEWLTKTLHQSLHSLNLINWELGDYAVFNLSSLFGSGEMKKYVDREEGESIWVNTEISILGQKQKVEAKISRTTGEILDYIENGQRKTPPSNEAPEILEQEEDSITVPAGTFDAIRMKLRSKEGQNMEVWLNPSKVTLEGTIKMKIKAQLAITMELTAFGKASLLK